VLTYAFVTHDKKFKHMIFLFEQNKHPWN